MCPRTPRPPSFNLNVPWVVATALCVWFLLVHAPRFLSAREHVQPLLRIHLVGACSVYFACVHNTLVTPSTSRPLHVWIGRAGLVLGVVGFVTGFVLVWFTNDYRDNWGFSIGITYGGLAQMHLEFAGYRAIKSFRAMKARIAAGEYENEEELASLEGEQDERLKIHIELMVNLFVLACGIPALMRICDAVGYGYLPLFLALVFGLSHFMARPFLRKMEAALPSEGNVDESSFINK